jgi:methylmalonyl-CoA/ethylmalonyl-CoA epimerase
MVRRIDHIGIAVADLEAAAAAYSAALGLDVERTEAVPSQGIRACHLVVGETRIELLAPLGPSSPIARFLERHGPGVHHLAFVVEDVDDQRARMVACGLEPVGEPTTGAGGMRIQFFHPRSTGGVLIEICSETGPGSERSTMPGMDPAPARDADPAAGGGPGGC